MGDASFQRHHLEGRGRNMGLTANLKVDQERLWRRHMLLAEIGATGGGGVNRQAMTDGDRRAHELVVQWGAEIGLKASVDPIGNLFLRREGGEPNSAPILSGSHLDTQPTGGKFDGAYGVLAALEALTRLTEEQVRTAAPVELVVWNNEEGCRFEPTTMGSRVFSGALDLESALDATDPEGGSVRDSLTVLTDLGDAVATRPLGLPVAAYVEAHIEQGPVLEQVGCPVGVVSGIQGLRWFSVDVCGRAGHAGTTPEAKRYDALMASVAVLQALKVHFRDPDDVVRFTVGRLEVTPNSPNTIPEHVRFTIDFRHPDARVLTRLGDRVADVCREAVGVCEVEVAESPTSPPIRFDDTVVAALCDVADKLNLPCTTLHSGATHDAKWLSHVAPSGMIFIPCKDGLSHNELESASPDALADGAELLTNTLVRLANDSVFVHS